MYLRDGTGGLAVVALAGDRLLVGRAPGNAVELAWDPRVSSAHACLERRGRDWVLEDDGLSRNARSSAPSACAASTCCATARRSGWARR